MSPTIAKDPTIENVFPSGVLKHERWGLLVDGLNEDVIPEGTLFGSAVSIHSPNRIFHLLDCNEERVKVGVFKSLSGEQAPCYAVIFDRAPLGSTQANDMVDAYEQRIKAGQFLAFPRDVLPTVGNANQFVEQQSASVRPALS